MASPYPNQHNEQRLPAGAYPPQNINGPSPFDTSSTNFTYRKDDSEIERPLARTPSPTPSEARALQQTSVIDWKRIGHYKYWLRKEWIWYYIALILILTITALITIYHKQIVHWLTPVTKWLHDLKFGWLVPVGILFVISFPPLFGHEIVAILCGLVWGLGIGFAIVAAGTFLGEVGNYYAFKYCCRSRAEKMERTKIPYACLAKSVREGGFKIILMARLSAIPGHFTTAVFSSCRVNIFIFSIAAILSLPKQFITVYLGVILEQSGTAGGEDTKSRIISDSVLALSFLITIFAMWYILNQMNKVKPQVIYERRKARQAKLTRSLVDGGSSVTLNPNLSDTNIPLNRQQYLFGSEYQYGSHSPTHVFAPKPVQSRGSQPNTYGYVKDDDLGSDESGSTISHIRDPAGVAAKGRYNTGDEVEWDMGAHGRQPQQQQQFRPPPPGVDQYQQQQRAMSPPQGYYPPPSSQPQQQYMQPPSSSRQGPPPSSMQPQQPYTSRQEPHNYQVHAPSPLDFQQQQQPQYQPQPQQQQQQYQPFQRARTMSPPVEHTPTQAQYATIVYPDQQQQRLGASSTEPLPSPSYHNANPPPLQQHQYGHSHQHTLEPTGMSYHTAAGSSDSAFSREPSDVSSDGGYVVPGGFGRR